MVQLATGIARLNSVQLLLMGLHKRKSVHPASATIFAIVEAVNHNCDNFHHLGLTAQSFG
jgi:hypothetical protein